MDAIFSYVHIEILIFLSVPLSHELFPFSLGSFLFVSLGHSLSCYELCSNILIILRYHFIFKEEAIEQLTRSSVNQHLAYQLADFASSHNICRCPYSEGREPYSGAVTLILLFLQRVCSIFLEKIQLEDKVCFRLHRKKIGGSGINSSMDLQFVFVFSSRSYSHPLTCMLSPRTMLPYYSFGNGYSPFAKAQLHLPTLKLSSLFHQPIISPHVFFLPDIC